MEPFIGQIQLFGFGWAPQGWATCDGQLLSISSNTALFSLLGTTYGGDGRTTFALPDLRGRVPLHQGQGPGLSSYVLGEVLGQESVTLTTQQMPSHTHGIQGTATAASKSPRRCPRPPKATPYTGKATARRWRTTCASRPARGRGTRTGSRAW